LYTRGHPRDPSVGVDIDVGQPRQIDHETIFEHRKAGRMMTAATHGNGQVTFPRKGDTATHI
jgi:hypothetical protein